MLNYEFPPLGGGAANATYYLLKEFSKFKDLNIDLVTSSTEKYKIEQFSNNIKIHYLDINKKGNIHFQSSKDLLTYSWKARKYCKDLIKKSQYDLCHAFFGIPCGYIAMKLGLPYIVSLRGSDVPFHNPKFKTLDKLFFRRLSMKVWKRSMSVIANSEDLKNSALKTNPDQKIGVISNGINIEEFKPSFKDAKKDKITMISTGRITKVKGFDYAIEGLKDLKDVELKLVGDGNLITELQDLSRKLNVKTTFTGIVPHNEIATHLKEADIFISSSLNEGMSNSLLEAMACGLPIIATDTGGSKELIKNNGFVIKKESSNEIKNAIEKYIKNRDLISLHSKNSRKIAENLSWKIVAQKYHQEYKK